MSIKVLNTEGKEVSVIEVASSEPLTTSEQGLLHQSVRRILAGRRAGTHSVLTRAGVRGGGRKPHKQKGTGKARAGTSSSPLWVGGGVAHGPSPRDYSFKINKKETFKATQCALRQRVSEGNFVVVEDLSTDKISTKDATQNLKNLGIKPGQKVLLVVDHADETLVKSFRNIKGVELGTVMSLNAHNILNNRKIITTVEQAKVVLERYEQLN